MVRLTPTLPSPCTFLCPPPGITGSTCSRCDFAAQFPPMFRLTRGCCLRVPGGLHSTSLQHASAPSAATLRRHAFVFNTTAISRVPCQVLLRRACTGTTRTSPRYPRTPPAAACTVPLVLFWLLLPCWFLLLPSSLMSLVPVVPSPTCSCLAIFVGSVCAHTTIPPHRHAFYAHTAHTHTLPTPILPSPPAPHYKQVVSWLFLVDHHPIQSGSFLLCYTTAGAHTCYQRTARAFTTSHPRGACLWTARVPRTVAWPPDVRLPRARRVWYQRRAFLRHGSRFGRIRA